MLLQPDEKGDYLYQPRYSLLIHSNVPGLYEIAYQVTDQFAGSLVFTAVSQLGGAFANMQVGCFAIGGGLCNILTACMDEIPGRVMALDNVCSCNPYPALYRCNYRL